MMSGVGSLDSTLLVIIASDLLKDWTAAGVSWSFGLGLFAGAFFAFLFSVSFLDGFVVHGG